MKDEIIYVAPSLFFSKDAKVFTTENLALNFMKDSTCRVYKVSKKMFVKFKKIAVDAFIRNPNDWTFNKIRLEHRECIYGTL